MARADGLREITPEDIERVRGIVGASAACTIDRFDDMVADGLVGLWLAAQRFDPECDVDFWAYAVARIRGEVLDGLRRVDYLTRHHRRKVKAGRTPPVRPPRSVEELNSEGDHRWGDRLAWHEHGVGGQYEDHVAHDVGLEDALCAVRGRDGAVLRWWLDDWTLTEISEVLDVTPSRVWQRLQRGLKTLCTYLNVTCPEDLCA